jgi:hypothetical protein
MSDDLDDVDLEEMGPIDWLVLGWMGQRPEGAEIAPLIVDLADRGIIRVLDIAFVSKEPDGSMIALELDHLGADSPFAVFDGASSGLIHQADLEDAAASLDPGDSAAVIVYENRWAAPLAIALRRSGGLLLASGRIETQAVIAALDALDAAAAT